MKREDVDLSPGIFDIEGIRELEVHGIVGIVMIVGVSVNDGA